MGGVFVLTGGSRSQLGLLEQARAFGHEICVVDGSDSAPLLAEADVGIVRSFADVEGVLADLEAQGIEPEAVATMGSDQAVLPTARLAARLGLPGLPVDTAETVADKRKMRAAFDAAGVRCPLGREAVTPEQAAAAFAELGPPLVVKPVDGSAQRGVTEVRAERELAAAAERAFAASKAGAIVLEQYVGGDEYTVNGFLLEGEYFPMSVTQRLLHPPPPLGVCLAHRYPSGLGEREGGPGSDAVRANVLWMLGELTRDDLGADPAAALAPCGQVRFVVAPPGRIVRLDAAPALALEGVHEAGFYWREGMVLPPLASGAERLGYLLLTAPDESELNALTDRALAALDVEIAAERALV